jgi:hypothetical protein
MTQTKAEKKTAPAASVDTVLLADGTPATPEATEETPEQETAPEPTDMLCRVTTDRKPAYEGRNLLQNEVLPLPPYMANMLISRGWAVLVKA